MKKAKERLDAEAKLNMTPEQKLSNFWFYNKWIVLGAIIGVLLVAFFLRDILTKEFPDYQISVVTPYLVSDSSLHTLEAAIKPYVDDRNGDGKVIVSINHYTLSTEDMPIADPFMQMAGMTRFSGDLQLCESVIFLLSDPTYYQKVSESFQLKDGSEPLPETDYPPEMIGVPIAECKALAPLTDVPELVGLYLAKRLAPNEKLRKEPDIANYFVSSELLYANLVNG